MTSSYDMSVIDERSSAPTGSNSNINLKIKKAKNTHLSTIFMIEISNHNLITIAIFLFPLCAATSSLLFKALLRANHNDNIDGVT